MDARAFSGRAVLVHASEYPGEDAVTSAAVPSARPSSGELDRALVVADLVVELDGTRILRGASLSVDAGEIHALIGPNGAGKTTLANVITGHVTPLAGTVELYGELLTGATWRRIRKGVGRKFQIPRVFPRLTAEENLVLAHATGDTKEVELDVSEIRSVRGDMLSHGWRQRLEMLMVAARKPRLAVLDEPTAGMTKTERGELAQMILASRGRATYLIVEHDMDFVQTVADRVSFMHEGQVTATGTFAEIESNPIVRQIYLGEGIGEQASDASPEEGL